MREKVGLLEGVYYRNQGSPVYLLIQVRDYHALCPTFEQGRTLGELVLTI